MAQPRILAFAGSARQQSWNHRLVQVAAAGAAAAGADVTLISLGDYPLPVFDEDLEAEQGTPDAAKQLKQLFLEHDGLLISAPEYNSSITPLLKNTIDWVSRRAEGEPPKAAFLGKVAALMSTSPGALGGLRGLVHVRSILSSISVLVLPDQIAVPMAHEAFGDDGALKDVRQQEGIEGLGRQVTDTLRKLAD